MNPTGELNVDWLWPNWYASDSFRDCYFGEGF